jgi:integrase/recombinase XerD
MGGFPARLHLPFAQWPELDKVLWGTALAAADPFEPTTGGRLSAASRQRYFMGWRRFVGFLALCEPEALQLSPAERLCPDRIKGFAHHLAETCSPGSVATGVEAAYHAARIMMPDLTLAWLKAVKTRLLAAVPPRPESRPAITSLQLLGLGQQLMEEVRPKLGPKLLLREAIQYRDGLMIALTAFAPMRRKNVAEFDLLRNLQLGNESLSIVVAENQSKTGMLIEFEFPPLLLPYLDEYREFVRPRITPRNAATRALWMSPKGCPLSYGAIGGIFARHSMRRLGFRLRPHDVRAAGATTWAVYAPDQIEVAQELLGHRDIRITTTYYNRASGIQASRSYAQVLRKLRG